jgi:hypothetical protein
MEVKKSHVIIESITYRVLKNAQYTYNTHIYCNIVGKQSLTLVLFLVSACFFVFV